MRKRPADRGRAGMFLVLRGVRVIDGLGHVRERGTILIQNDRIAEVGDARHVSIPRGAIEVDARGMTVLPGLIDCHVHLCLGGEPDVVKTTQAEDPALTLLKAASSARRTLEAGFTTVRDLGFRNHAIFALKKAIETGLLPGPRIQAAGLAICMTGGHARFIGREADGPSGIVDAVREQLSAGADVIKFIASGGVLTPGTLPDRAQLTQEELAAGIAEARRNGRRVAAHAHATEGMKNAIRAGAHSIEHATLMDQEASDLMRKQGVYMVPTLSALATAVACGLAAGIPEDVVNKAQALRARHSASFKQAHRAGILIAMGTDAGTPFNYHGENAHELERMVALGMSPMEAIVAGTSSAASLLGIDHLIGTLEKGKLADLVIVNGNPIRRISILQEKNRIAGVMQAGRLVSGPLSKRA